MQKTIFMLYNSFFIYDEKAPSSP